MGKSETGPVSQAKTSEGRKTRTDKGSVSVQSVSVLIKAVMGD